jgi:hypothetical protein
MQVAILPSHGDLQNAMKLLERRLAGELDASPDGSRKRIMQWLETSA